MPKSLRSGLNERTARLAQKRLISHVNIRGFLVADFEGFGQWTEVTGSYPYYFNKVLYLLEFRISGDD